MADAHRGGGKRFVVHADEKLTAFVELESAIRAAAMGLTFSSRYVRLNRRACGTRLQDALERLTAAIRDVESELTAMKAEHDPPCIAYLLFRAAIIGMSTIRKVEAP